MKNAERRTSSLGTKVAAKVCVPCKCEVVLFLEVGTCLGKSSSRSDW